MPEHVLLHCPCLSGTRLLPTGNIYLEPSQLWEADLVAALVAGYHRHREPIVYGPTGDRAPPPPRRLWPSMRVQGNQQQLHGYQVLW